MDFDGSAMSMEYYVMGKPQKFTDKEYEEIIAWYEAKPQAELEWKLLDGFWMP